MAVNSNGQISYLVLDSLSHGSKYGLEIIEFITKKTNGSFILKKPSLYSCLTRMEKKGLISSSYWGESEFGGKRHYYTITSQGKKSLEALASEFSDFDFTDETEETREKSTHIPAKTTKTVQETEKPFQKDTSHPQKTMFLQQENFFDIEKRDKKTISAQIETEDENDIVENQIDFFTYESQQPPVSNDETSEDAEMLKKIQYYQSILEKNLSVQTEKSLDKQDDARFLDRTEQLISYQQQQQNKMLYDTSTELKKYRKKKSFSENQIEMSVVYENVDDKEIQKERIEQLKKSMLNARQSAFVPTSPAEPQKEKIPPQADTSAAQNNFVYKKEDFSYRKETETKTPSYEEEKDDAIFITTPRIEDGQFPIQRKITPPNIEINIYDDNLPAPKRNSNLEPTYKDMMAKLFERKKEKSSNPSLIHQEEMISHTETDSFADYATLKKYYSGHGIEFKEYKNSSVERCHNTNLLNFVSGAILLLLSGIGSGILFGIFNALNLLRPETNFLFYTMPSIFFIYTIYTFVKYKVYPSKKAVLIYNSIINWAIFIFSVVIVYVIHVMCGMQYETMNQFLSSLLIPTWGLLLAFPVNYYIKKIAYKKFAK